MTAAAEGSATQIQVQINTEALRVASRAELLAEKIAERQTRHEDECLEERRAATVQRHDFRAEVALGIGGLREEMKSGFEKQQASNSRIHGRINALIIGVGGYIITTLIGALGVAVWALLTR